MDHQEQSELTLRFTPLLGGRFSGRTIRVLIRAVLINAARLLSKQRMLYRIKEELWPTRRSNQLNGDRKPDGAFMKRQSICQRTGQPRRLGLIRIVPQIVDATKHILGHFRPHPQSVVLISLRDLERHKATDKESLIVQDHDI